MGAITFVCSRRVRGTYPVPRKHNRHVNGGASMKYGKQFSVPFVLKLCVGVHFPTSLRKNTSRLVNVGYGSIWRCRRHPLD